MVNEWLYGLRSSGLLVSPPVLEEELPEGPPELSQESREALRQAWNRFDAGTIELDRWLKEIVHGPLGVENRPLFLLGEEADEQLRIPRGLESAARPDGALFAAVEGSREARVLVWTLDTSTKPRATWNQGCAGAQRLLREMRQEGVELGLVTDGSKFRLLYSGVETEAYIQWDSTRWFGEEPHHEELNAFAWLLHADRLGLHQAESPLVELTKRSRKKQADLADQLGERVRRAVENLLTAAVNTAAERAELRGEDHPLDVVREGPGGTTVSQDDALQAVYQGGIRMVMRVVVASYAEALELLPMDDPGYSENYAISSLHENLRNTKERYGEQYLETRQWAWPRLLSLFRLIYEGSDHPELRIKEYGGLLFQTGREESEDAVLRALSLFEDTKALSDAAVLRVLDNVRRAEFTANIEGRRRRTEGAVDFSELQTEYIGMMYEGLLDYTPVLVEPEHVAYVELKGDGFHAYPLDRLERLAQQDDLPDFLDAVRRKDVNRSDHREEALEQLDEELEEVEYSDEPEQDGERQEDDKDLQSRVSRWAMEAVTVTNIAGTDAEEDEIEEAADDLVQDIHSPGTMFLMSWEGLRKGSGTYYTRPSLVIPLVRRTLEPQLYEDVEESIPKTPEEILDLKVCDPAVGSGSFLVAAADQITDALYESWRYHGLIDRLREGDRLLMPAGEAATGIEEDRLVRKHPEEDENFEEWLSTRLKRYVVENCLYGVDLNPLAVELTKLSLWIETMDPDLPFEFLDHKIRRGNSLIGAWVNEAFDYPIAAWDRYSDLRTENQAGKDPLKLATVDDREWLKQVRKDAKSELRDIIPGLGSVPLNGVRVDSMQEEVSELYERIHELPEERREEAYAEFRGSEKYQTLKHALDRWCALWFWPTPDEEDSHALEPLPSWFYNSWPPEFDDEMGRLVDEIAIEKQFFHWELEFPDVFIKSNSGFDAVIGNPPWDKIKAESELFFTRHDPLFRTYGKQQALDNLRKLFESSPHIQNDWRDYKIDQKSMSHFAKNSVQAFMVKLGERGEKPKTTAWYDRVKPNDKEDMWYSGEIDVEYPPSRPFALWTGGREIDYYKLFLEQSLRMEGHGGGRTGLVLPGGLVTGDAKALRSTILEEFDWEWLYSFENRQKIFPTHSSYIFSCNVLGSEGPTQELKSAFMIQDPEQWAANEDGFAIQNIDTIRRFSPEALVPPQPQEDIDLEIMEDIRATSNLLHDYREEVQYGREFDTTGDSNLFTSGRSLSDGLTDIFGRILSLDGGVYYPLYRQRMFRQFDPARDDPDVRHDSWPRAWWDKRPRVSSYMEAETYSDASKRKAAPKLWFRRNTNITNERTFLSSILPEHPSLDSVFMFQVNSVEEALRLQLNLSSLAVDFYIRHKTMNTNMSEYVVSEFPLNTRKIPNMVEFSHQLALCAPFLAVESLVFKSKYNGSPDSWSGQWAWDGVDRLDTRIKYEVTVANIFDIDIEQWEQVCRVDEVDRRGFHRMDDDLPKSDRYPQLALQGYKDFQREYEAELDDFLREWQIPEESISIRDEVRGRTWRGAQPDERLPKEIDEEQRYAIHYHRDNLGRFIERAQNSEIPSNIIEPYERLWQRVWENDPSKTTLDWSDCAEYARCFLTHMKPDGAWERLQDVIEGKRPYRYVFDPEVAIEQTAQEIPESRTDGDGANEEWGDLQPEIEDQRDLNDFV